MQSHEKKFSWIWRIWFLRLQFQSQICPTRSSRWQAVSTQKVDNAVTSLLDLEPEWSIPIWRESACIPTISNYTLYLCVRRLEVIHASIGNADELGARTIIENVNSGCHVYFKGHLQFKMFTSSIDKVSKSLNRRCRMCWKGARRVP